MIGTGLAILGAGLLGAGASIYGANKASNAQQDAANSAAAVQREALGLQRDNLDIQRQNFGDMKTNLNPYLQTGAGANNLLQQFYGIGPNGQLGPSSMDGFLKSPDYNFALSQGTAALDNSAASKGGLLGGNQIRAQTEYGQGLATTQLQNYMARLTGLSQQGLQAGGYLGQVGSSLGNGAAAGISSTSNNLGNTLMAGGTAQAAGINGMVKGFDSGLNSLSLYNQLGKSSYAPSGYLPTGGTGLGLTGTGGLY